MRNLCKRIAYISVVATFLIFIGGIERARAYGSINFVATSTYVNESLSYPDVTFDFPFNDNGDYFVGCLFVGGSAVMGNQLWDNSISPLNTGTAYFKDPSSPFWVHHIFQQVGSNSYAVLHPGVYTLALKENWTGSCVDVVSNPDFVGSFYFDEAFQYNLSSSTETRIIKLEPETGSTTPSNSVYFNYEVYLSEEDMEESGSVGMKLYLHNIDQNVVLLSAFSPSDIVLVDTYATTSGYWRYSTTTNLGTGNYRLYAKIAGTWGNLFGSPLAEGCALGSDLVGITCLEANTAFTVVEDTFIGRLQQDSFGMLNDYATSSTATTTSGYAKACIPWSTSFDVVNCGSFLFIPDSYYLNSTLINFKNNVATHFPIGYVTDFVSILATTTAGSLTVIDATLPSGVAGTGAHITLDLNGVLDPILYATTSQFVNESASNTGSLYSITSYYWNIIVYVLTILYFVRRIIGSHIIPDLGNMWADSSYNPRVTFGGAVEREYKLGKKKGLWKNRDQYMND